MGSQLINEYVSFRYHGWMPPMLPWELYCLPWWAYKYRWTITNRPSHTHAVGAYKEYKSWVICFCFLKKLLLICVAVFGIWYPTAYGEQAVHHESRRICLRHSQHLPGYRLYLLLFPPDLWNKARVNLSTRAAPITEM